jgi:hypothetical protein
MKHAFVLLLALAAGCSGAPDGGADGFPETPYATVMTDAGTLRVEIRTAPTQPPARGLLEVEYAITDAQGAPRDGLSLTVDPWMPEMGHGASVEPTVEPLGGGLYRVSRLGLYMPGRWQLRTGIAGAASDHVVIDLDVQ